jgi:hypothetical protein
MEYLLMLETRRAGKSECCLGNFVTETVLRLSTC